MNAYPRVWVEIDLRALSQNIAQLRAAFGPSGPLMALVAKADAYGHGLAPVARHALAAGVDWIAVAAVSEGAALRDAGVEARVLTLSPILPEEAEQAVFYGLDVSVESAAAARALSLAGERQGRPARAHLKVDTGLNRFGAKPAAAVEQFLEIRGLPGLEMAGCSTHFVDSLSSPDRTFEQWTVFSRVVQELRHAGFQGVVHAANSFGALGLSESRADLVRIGIAAYGIDPAGRLPGLRPVMRMQARVLSVRTAEPGETVGYCGAMRLARRSRIATLGAGYGDGVPRAASGSAQTAWRGLRLPVAGLICMDQMMVDATDAPGLEPGDAVEIFGGEISAAELAGWAGTNSHEIVTRIMPRAPRRYLS